MKKIINSLKKLARYLLSDEINTAFEEIKSLNTFINKTYTELDNLKNSTEKNLEKIAKKLYNDRLNFFIEKNNFKISDFDKSVLYKIIDNKYIYYYPVFINVTIYYIPIYNYNFDPIKLTDIYPDLAITPACIKIIYYDKDIEFKFLEIDEDLINNNTYREIWFSDSYDTDMPTACGVVKVPGVYKTDDSIVLNELSNGFII